MGDSPTPEEFRIVIDRAFSIMSLDVVPEDVVHPGLLGG